MSMMFFVHYREGLADTKHGSQRGDASEAHREAAVGARLG